MFLPAVRPLLELAAEVEQQRNHVITPPKTAEFDDLDDAGELLNAPEPGRVMGSREVMESSAEFAHLLSGGRAILAGDISEPPAGGDDDTFGLFTADLLSPADTAALLAARDRKLRAAARAAAPAVGQAAAAEELSPWRAADDLRRKIHHQVARIAHTTGQAHAQIHSAARRAVPGAATAQADPGLLRRRLDWLKHA